MMFARTCRRWGFLAAAALVAAAACAEPVCIDGVCYPSPEAARAAGVTLPAAPASAAVAPAAETRRVAFGYMDAPAFCAFLRDAPAAESLEDHALAVVLLLVLLGGLAANLTPCVLPLVPVNLILIGRGWRRGAAYAAGIATTYGVLGLAAAFGGLAFGALQASAWFNAGVAAVFLVLAAAMTGLFTLPGLGRQTRGGASGALKPAQGLKGPYLLGLGAATLASACVEPILIATLLLTAKWFAAGRLWAVVLPFVLGAGMGLPYPFAAAGFSVLPRPGAWMVWVKRAFAVVFVAMAVWYGRQAVRLWRPAPARAVETAAVDAAGDARPVLIILGAPWCGSCTAMARTTLVAPEVVRELARFRVRKIEIADFGELTRYPELSGLSITGVPAYIILPSASAGAAAERAGEHVMQRERHGAH